VAVPHVCLTDRLPFLHTHTDYMAPPYIHTHTYTHFAIHLIDCGHVGCGVFMGAGSRDLRSGFCVSDAWVRRCDS